MALEDLEIRPGLFTLRTDRDSQGRWKTGNHVRFHNGLPQKIGGWVKSATSTFLGICRGITDWVTLADIKYIGLGTHLKWYVYVGGTFYDITPIRSSGTYANDPFAVVDTSTTVTVTHTSHGAVNGDYVTIAGATAGGGITVSGEYQLTYVDANSYTITHGSAATSTDSTTGGAAATFSYQINAGGADNVPGLGYGIGPYGGGTWDTTRTSGGTIIAARTWTQDQWGEDLIGCPRNGGIYVWDASTGTGTRATVISQAPTSAKGIFVSPEDKHLVAYGAHNGTYLDPMLVRWSDSNDYTYWTVADGHTAGVKRLTTGTEIVTHIKAAGETCLFTDSNLWTMAFEGPPYTFAWKDRGANGKIAGPNAAVQVDGKVWWMGQSDFYVYDGTITPISCDVHNHVFDSLNTDQRVKISCGFNRKFREIWWHYPSLTATENDSYVTYNIYEKTWAFGTLVRTMFVGDSKIFSDVYATGSDGYLYSHENGTDADAQALSATLESWDVEVPNSKQLPGGPGDYVMHIGRAIPDFKVLTGSVIMTLVGKKFPQDTETITKGPYTILSSTSKINPRMRCRQISIQIESAAIGDHWRYGGIRPDVKQHGKR